MAETHPLIPVVLCCADESEILLVNVVEALRDEGLAPEVLSGVDADPALLGHAVDRNKDVGVYVLCESEGLDRSMIRRLDGLFSARKGPRHRLVVVRVNRQRPLTMLPTIREAVEVLRRAPAHRPEAPTGGRNLRDFVGAPQVDAVRRPREPRAESTPITPDELARQLTAAMEAAEAALDRRRSRERQPSGPRARTQQRTTAGPPLSGSKRPTPVGPHVGRPSQVPAGWGTQTSVSRANGEPSDRSPGQPQHFQAPTGSPEAAASQPALPRPPTVAPSSSTFEGIVPSASSSHGRAPVRVNPLPRPSDSGSAPQDSSARLGPVPTVSASSPRLSLERETPARPMPVAAPSPGFSGGPGAPYARSTPGEPPRPVPASWEMDDDGVEVDTARQFSVGPRLPERSADAMNRAGGASTIPYPVPAPTPGAASSSAMRSTRHARARTARGPRMWVLAASGALALLVVGVVLASLDPRPAPTVDSTPPRLAQGSAPEGAARPGPAQPEGSAVPGLPERAGVPSADSAPTLSPSPSAPTADPVEAAEPTPKPTESPEPSPAASAPSPPKESEPSPVADPSPAAAKSSTLGRKVTLAVAAGKMHAVGRLLWLDPSTNAMDYIDAAGLCSVVAVDGIDSWRLPTKVELTRLRGGAGFPSGVYWSRTKAPGPRKSKPKAAPSDSEGSGGEALPSIDEDSEALEGEDEVEAPTANGMVVLDGTTFGTLDRAAEARALCVRWY